MLCTLNRAFLSCALGRSQTPDLAPRLRSPRYQIIQRLGGLALLSLQEMRVDVHRKARGAVAEATVACASRNRGLPRTVVLARTYRDQGLPAFAGGGRLLRWMRKRGETGGRRCRAWRSAACVTHGLRRGGAAGTTWRIIWYTAWRCWSAGAARIGTTSCRLAGTPRTRPRRPERAARLGRRAQFRRG